LNDFSPNATQIASRFCEVFASKSKFREEWIRECFHPFLQLSTFEGTLLQEKEALLQSICSSEGHRSEPLKQVFISNEGNQFTFALHFYGPSKSPCFGQAKFSDAATIVLYRATSNKIDNIWISLDEANLGSDTQLDAATLQKTPIWSLLVALVKAVSKGKVELHYNNYAVNVDLIGAGLGTTSKQESWEMDC